MIDLGARRDGLLDARRVEVVRPRVGLDGDGRRARVGDGEPRGDVGVRGDDDLVARPDAQRAQDQVQRVEPVADADAVARAAVGGELRLEGLALGRRG